MKLCLIYLFIYFKSQLQFGIKSCFHSHTEDVVIRITMGYVSFITLHLNSISQIICILYASIFTYLPILIKMSISLIFMHDFVRVLIQILCSYVTLPLYALVTQVHIYINKRNANSLYFTFFFNAQSQSYSCGYY